MKKKLLLLFMLFISIQLVNAKVCYYHEGGRDEFTLQWGNEKVLVKLTGSQYNNYCKTEVQEGFTASDFENDKCPEIGELKKTRHEGNDCKGKLIISKKNIFREDGDLTSPSDEGGESNIYLGDDINSPTIGEIENCTSLLGSPDTKPNGDTPGSPAYYLSVAFSVLRYIAIAILIVMSVMDFIQATSAQDDDAIKKAVAKTTKRLIMCIIIFILPILIQFLLEFVHNKQTDLCGIGKVN